MAKASRKVRLVLLELLAAPDATSREARDHVERLYPLDETGRHRAEIARSRGLLAERVEALAVRLATALGDHTLACELAEQVRIRHLARAPVAVLGIRTRPPAAASMVSPEQIRTDVEGILGKDGER